MDNRKTDEQLGKDRRMVAMLAMSMTAGISFFAAIFLVFYGNSTAAGWTSIPAVIIYSGYLSCIIRAVVEDRKALKVNLTQ